MLKRIAIGAVAAVVIAYIGVLVFLYANQRAFFFAPDGDVWAIADIGLDAEVVSIPTSNGETVTGWYGQPDAGMGTILYLKGNSGSFSAEYERFLAFEEAGYGFLAIDYRGFPLSPGEITQDNILADAVGAFDWLAEREDEIFVWGRSLGASPAVWVANQREAQALLLETPFLSAVNVASERYPYVPVGLLMTDQFRSDEWIGAVSEPVFVVHGTADTVISHSNGERLYALADNGYDIWIEEGAGHSDMWDRGIWDRAQDFFEDSVATQ
jgi:uncharacterized protein